MGSEIIKSQLDAYRPNFLKHGASPLGTFQNNTTTQRERHRQLLQPLLTHRPDGFSICDIGSGLCDLHQYLNDTGVAHTYTGVEIVPEMVVAAQKMHPDARILNVDFLDSRFSERFDFVVLSGTFNIPGITPLTQWKQFVYQMISRMYDRADVAISFNALTTYTTFRSKELFYLGPGEAISFIHDKLSRFCLINSAYPLFELTYTVFRPEAISLSFPQTDFDKYFSRC